MTDTGSATLKQVAQRVTPDTHEAMKRLARVHGRRPADEYRAAVAGHLARHSDALNPQSTAA